MALVIADRVQETTTTTGTGTVTLGGAVTGYQSFAVIGNANTTYYTITDPATGDWEVGIGTYTSSGTTLSRDTVLASSNSNTLVPFGAGGKFVFATYPAGKAVYEDASNNVTLPGNLDVVGTLAKNGTAAYTLKNVTYLTSGTNATYTTPTGVRALKVTVVGGGGGGGGVDGQGASTYAVSTGGAGGGWAEALITSAEASYTYTVGAAGTGGAAGNTNGATGGTSEFKNGAATVVISATGGVGGNGDLGAASAGSAGVIGGIGSLTGVTGITAAGMGSTYSRVLTSTYTQMSQSGGSKFGGGQTVSQPGAAARVYGEGGGATYAGAVTTNYAGGNGYQGAIIVEEYF